MKRTSWLFLLPVLLFSMFSGYQAQAQQRKGWSPQGKGAAIGGAAGILGGALINKRNRVVGGAIGGVAGAGVGYAIGKHTDNKRKKAAALAAERAAANQRIAAANARAAAAERTAAAERAATERQSVASSPGSIARVAGATTLVAASAGAAQGFAATPPPAIVAAGYLPNNQFGASGTAYPASEVRRKSW
ncbi:hypothetical protein GO988_16545 [Hymenobacter sp. HMF4947]|uniref:Glycine zipper domain-containing protein n=2 Tax=Hymenobacter ginkgonis TaxID=2682976 RepID=A0A7K1THN9_9BACT|nr:hypothetical protein [Hymenobacter ginkgonis]